MARYDDEYDERSVPVARFRCLPCLIVFAVVVWAVLALGGWWAERGIVALLHQS